jgi:hypothetical protein
VEAPLLVGVPEGAAEKVGANEADMDGVTEGVDDRLIDGLMEGKNDGAEVVVGAPEGLAE